VTRFEHMPFDTFKPVRDTRSHNDKIIEQIVDALLRGDLKPAKRLPAERDLALQFSVSRTVVLDAIKMLAGRGVVEVRHGSGIYIAADDATVLEQLDQVSLQDVLKDRIRCVAARLSLRDEVSPSAERHLLGTYGFMPDDRSRGEVLTPYQTTFTFNVGQSKAKHEHSFNVSSLSAAQYMRN